MSSSADVGSDEEQLVIKSSKQDELNDLLGGSDDEDSKAGGNELNDLLGNSDDDSDAGDVNNETDTPLPATSGGDQEGARFDELEQILGKADIKSSFKDQRAKTKSKVVLPATYKVPSDYVSAFVRTPNFIKIQTQAFDEAIHDVEAERKDFDGSTAVVRWRIKRDENGEIVLDAAGKPVKESNARMIQWSDGSMQLVVGDAVFQCKNSDVDNCYVYEQQNVHVLSTAEVEVESGKTDTCLECIGSINLRLALQPTSLDSESHARMSMKISEKHKKESKIRDRDYEQITEKPEHTIANLARIEEEKMRKDKKIKDRQYTSGNTITGNARFIRRPAMSAEYLAGGYDDDEGEAEEADERFERPKPRAVVPAAAKPSKDQVKAKPKAAPKKKGPVSSDYLEYDEEDGSDMEDDDEGDDNEEMEDDDDDEEGEDDDDDEEEEEEEEEGDEDDDDASDDGGASGGSDSGGDASPKKKKASAAGASGSKRDKKESKEARRARKAEKKAARRAEKKERRDQRDKDKEKRRSSKSGGGADEDGGRSKVSQKRPSTSASEARSEASVAAAPTAGNNTMDSDGDEEVAVQQRKRIKRAILDSDDDE